VSSKKSFRYRRFDINAHDNEYGQHHEQIDRAEGEYVLAQDALDREAVLQAQVRTLETQLKDSQKGYKQVGASWDGMILYARVQ
jgi:hypothetical protein